MHPTSFQNMSHVDELVSAEDKELMSKLPYASGLELEGMCDSSWGDDVDDKKSHAAFVFTMGGAAVSWRSWKIGDVSRSSTEAEYCAASDAAAEARGLSSLLRELEYAPLLPVKIHTDNKGAQAIIENNARRREPGTLT